MYKYESTNPSEPVTFDEMVDLAPRIGSLFEFYRRFASQCRTQADMRAHWLGYAPIDPVCWEVGESVGRLAANLGIPDRYQDMYRTVQDHFLNCRPELALVPPQTRHAFCYNDDEGEDDDGNW